ncbi:Serine/threonine-protein kinase PrkC [Thermoflexales bacterium]|nr:Serine/threonine-protein kinase PrkC [Thermoflexales bacterium]
MLGQILGDYELQQEIGRGPAATVYAARQHPVERYVAVKLFEPQARETAARLKELYTQLEQLDHTHILPIYDQGRWQDRYYWVMRYMPAGSLKTRLGKQRLTLEEIDRILPQIASALDHAHGHGVVHGDLKLTDILIDHAGQAFVTDFGVAAALGRSASDFHAPETWRGAAPDARTDVYSLGVVLYELLTLRPPIDPRTPEEERANRRLVPPAPSTVNSKLPAALDAVVLKALAVDPDQRYQTPGELVEAYLQARPGKQAPPIVEAAPLATAAPLDSRVRRVSARRAEPEKSNRWKIVGLIGGAAIGLMAIVALIMVAAQTPAAVSPSPIATPAPTTTRVPIATTMNTPAWSPTSTAPAATATTAISTSMPIATATATVRSTAVFTPTRAATRVLPTVTPPVTIAPLLLAFPRSEGRDRLALTFRTSVLPADAGIVGILSMAVPAVEPLVLERDLAQVGSGDQVLRVAVAINCGSMTEPIVSRQISLMIQDDAGRVLLEQTLDYEKRWCQ